MQIIQTSAIVKNGQLILNDNQSNLPDNTQLKVIILIPEEDQQLEFQQARNQMQNAFKQAGIETREQILDLIQEVKLELLQERQL